MSLRKRCLPFAFVVAVCVAVVAPTTAVAYQLFSQATGGSGVSPNRWQALPVAITVDNGSDDILAEITEAATTWNDVPTARAVFGTPMKATDGAGNAVDFTGANMGTAWGKLTGDGKHEVVYDKDGSALLKLGFNPSAVNGYGLSGQRVDSGQAVIDDMYLVINGTRTDFDRRATEVHELGHTLGIAHSSVGFYLGVGSALSPVSANDAPTMHPFSIGGGMQRRTLEADDRAGLSELYPEGAFTSTLGTISGTVKRCETDEPVLGVNVRAVNTANPAIQLTRVTGFDGAATAQYAIRGVPPGNYHVLVEPLSGNKKFLNGLAIYTPRVDTDFAQEYYNESKESSCGDDGDPQVKEPVAVGAGATATANVKVNPVELALVVDDTGSMSGEIGAVRAGLTTYIRVVQLFNAVRGKPFPNTAIVTFKDDVTIRTVSRDPDKLRTVVGGLTASGGGDCPESSNAALIAAGRLLVKDGRAVLATDADSRSDGPSSGTVAELYRSKGARLTTILSGTCTSAEGAASSGSRSGQSQALQNGDEMEPVDRLGVESSVTTFGGLSAFTGGVFSFQPEVKSGNADSATAYSNALANAAISAVKPAVAGVNPYSTPRGTTINVEFTGSRTSFGSASVLTVAGGGVSVLSTDVRSPTQLVARLSVDPGAALGFRDVNVTTDLGAGTTEVADGLGAVQVVVEPTAPTILSLTPSSAALGKTIDVTLAAAKTGFVDGTSKASFGSGITVNRLTVSSPLSAVANITVAPNANVGLRSVTVTTGSEVASDAQPGPGPFLIVPEPPVIPTLTKAAPSEAARDSTIDVTLTGENTAFESGKSVAGASGTGVDVLSTTVTSPTSSVAKLRIAPDAPLGVRDITMTTGGEIAALLNGFRVTPAVPVAVSPPPPGPPPPGPPPAGPPPLATGASATSPPRLLAAKVTLGKTLRFDENGRLLVSMRCAGARKDCRGRVTVSVRVGKRSPKLASARVNLKAGSSKTVRLKPRRTVLRRARGTRLRLTVIVVLSDGQRATLSKRIARPRR